MFGGIGPTELLIVSISLFSVFIPTIFACIIFSKAGYHWAMGLLVLLPIANLIVMIYFAFDRWPVLRELDLLKTNQHPLG